ncbi:expressed unknown protein [Seminavis robusta]|uniref:Uncharacterized protein n=1 Tax=Seminavis robusta TaxID=568900 RepID=A0A9N8E2U8_9STRA|nr:expressed unknown protein [Seminavis robusta]|eukprot:Sro594_g172460.1 n/a (315) ;mRNA; f:28106-29137
MMIGYSNSLFWLAITFVVATAEIQDEGLDLERIATAAIDKAIEIEGADFAKFQLEEAFSGERKLQNTDRQEGQRCGNNNQCADGLECVDVTIGRRCKPINCIANAIVKHQETFDPDEYKQTILQYAGFTESEFTLGVQTLNGPFGLRSNNMVDSFAAALEANPPPHKELRALVRKCERSGNNETDPNQSQPGSTTTYGFWIEVGAAGNVGFQVLSAQGEADAAAVTLNKWCIGGKAGGGLGLMFAYGVHGTGTYQDLINWAVQSSAGGAAGVGIFVANVCTILGLGGTIDGIETQAGVGGGGGVGVGGCTTSLG